MADDWLSFLGPGATRDLVGGICGGFAGSLLEPTLKQRLHLRLLQIFSKAIVGGLTAVFVSHPLQPLFGPLAEATPYFVGLGGYAICHAAITKVSAMIEGKKNGQ